MEDESGVRRLKSSRQCAERTSEDDARRAVGSALTSKNESLLKEFVEASRGDRLLQGVRKSWLELDLRMVAAKPPKN